MEEDMEEEKKLPSEDAVNEFMKAHYFEVEDIDYWIDRNKEILTRWQEEQEFKIQLEDDVVLRDIFRAAQNKREDTGDEDVWFLVEY
jgi:hypothetical protein